MESTQKRINNLTGIYTLSTHYTIDLTVYKYCGLYINDALIFEGIDPGKYLTVDTDRETKRTIYTTS